MYIVPLQLFFHHKNFVIRDIWVHASADARNSRSNLLLTDANYPHIDHLRRLLEGDSAYLFKALPEF